MTTSTITKLALTKKDLTALKSCLSSDETREVLASIHFGAGFVESTDGKMLFRIYLEHGVEPGVYKIIRESKAVRGIVEVTLEQIEAQYPNTDQVIPADRREFITVNVSKNPQVITSAALKLFTYYGAAYSVEFIERLSGLESSWDCHSVSKDHPVKMVSKYGDDIKYLAVVMPFSFEAAKVSTK